MRLLPLVFVALSTLVVTACDAKSDAKSETKSDAAKDPAADALKGKIVGTWVDAENDEIYELTDARFTSTHTKLEGAKPMQGTYTIVKAEGDTITIRPSLDLGEGKSFTGDDQVIKVVDADTIERHNAKNNAGGKFTRKKG